MLRIDGVLEFDADLVARIDAGELIEHDSPEEVEIRACALHAVELLVAGPRRHHRHRRRQRALEPRRRPALQGPPTPPCPNYCVLISPAEGFHALKHALRFGAEIVEVTGDRDEAERSRRALAPDLTLPAMTPGDEIIALASRPEYDLAEALQRPGPVVYLEEPRHLGNLGAAIRVSAAAGAAAVLTTGDPWHANAIRGAAGLQFALPGAARRNAPPSDRPLFAIDPEGEERRVPATRSSPSAQSVTGSATSSSTTPTRW